MEHKKNILIGCTGSVAAIKLPVVLNLLKKRNESFEVRNLSNFIDKLLCKIKIFSR
jgi:phosphopantothenoylcysteine synthetase/decarboxylase